ncbi:MAG: 3-oxoacyl-[acyl-carrier-protein] synthase III C-terminal domain-containing protein [Cyanobacteria bacterium P01_G01_bin.39]
MRVSQQVGIRSLAISFPSVKRTNSYYKNKYPEKVAQAEHETLAQVFSATESSLRSRDFDRVMQPYLSDPFRGTVERYVLDSDESSLTLETRAAEEAMIAGKFAPENIDLMLVASMFPEQVGVGNASLLVNTLGLNCPAWNIESIQSGALIGLQTACAMVKSGEYENVLVVVSCTYSRNLGGENDSLSWIAGDGAGAFLISSLPEGQGIISTNVINTAITNDAYSYSLIKDAKGNPRVLLNASKKMSRLIRNNSARFIRESCEGAIHNAGITLEQIDFFVFSTPLAWFAELFIGTLNINPKLTLDMYPYCGNIGSALPLANLYYAAKLGKIKKNSLVLLFSIGGSSTAAATIMRWGDVTLGSVPSIQIPDSRKTIPQNRELAIYHTS